jgi:putative proteasome-type protease
MLDRVVDAGMELDEAAKCVLVSYDATMRSNLSVGPPIDLASYAAWSYAPARSWRFAEGDAYFEDLRASWGRSLRAAFTGLVFPPAS